MKRKRYDKGILAQNLKERRKEKYKGRKEKKERKIMWSTVGRNKENMVDNEKNNMWMKKNKIIERKTRKEWKRRMRGKIKIFKGKSRKND